MKRRIEPGLLVIFRYYSAVAVAYFTLIITAAMRQQGSLSMPLQHWSWLNVLLFAFLFAYLSWPWLQRKMKAWYLPVAITLSVAVPLLSNLFDYFLPTQRTAEILITRSWMLFPILTVPLVLIAWQYEFKYVLLLIVLSTILDESMLIPAVSSLDLDSLLIMGQPLIRAFAFGIIGHILTHLLEIQRSQQRALLQANVEISKYSQTLEQLAVSRERNRIARELHDTLAHTLSGLAVRLEALKTTIDPEQTQIQEELERSLTVVRDGLKETRRVLKDLRPRVLEDLGLAAAIQNMSISAAERANFTVHTQLDNVLQLPHETEMNLYRIAQEALENVALHAGAKEVNVKLTQSDHHLTLLIEDDGAGFEPEELSGSGERFGITGMQERAALIGGKLTIDSSPAGTSLKMTMDL